MDRKIILLLLLSPLMMSCYDSFRTFTPSSEDEAPRGNATIEQIHTSYAAGLRTINEEVIVEGIVTANDEYGNFFKSFIIESEGYAIEVLDGLYDSYVKHPIGCHLSLRLNGLGLDRYLGLLRVGLVAPASSSYTLDYMTADAIIDQHISQIGFGEEVTPQQREINELLEERAGEFILIDGLTLHTEDGVERTWSDYALFRDKNLDTIWCYTSPYADFALSKIPQGTLSLRGILEYGSTDSYTNQFIIKLRGASDCIY
ncbi:MAG: DUF5689 domain-containing protein [Rikenellaceae bacterium]